MIFFSFVGSIWVARPTKVENTCLLKAPTMITSGRPPLGPLGAVGAGAGAVRGRRIGAARALRRVGLGPGEHRCGLARGGVVAGRLGLVGAAEDGLHVALELEAFQHLLIGELVIAAGVID